MEMIGSRHEYRHPVKTEVHEAEQQIGHGASEALNSG